MTKYAMQLSTSILPFLILTASAQNATPSAPPLAAYTQSAAGAMQLPDSPSHSGPYLLPPNNDVAVLPVTHTALTAEHEYSLAELIDIAERENPETRLAWLKARNAAIGQGMVSSTYLPLITASALSGYQGIHGENSGLGVTVGNDGNVSGSVEAISLQWLLFDFGGRHHLVDASKRLTTVANISFTSAHQQIIFAVSQAYYVYSAAVQNHQTSLEALVNTQEIEEAAKARYHHGEGTVIETAQANNLTAQAKLSLVSASGAKEKAYATLLAAMGISPLAVIQIAPQPHRLVSADEVASVDQVVRESLARRPDVQAAYNTFKASEASIHAAEAMNRPKIFLAATAAYVSGQLGITAVPSIGGQLPTLNITGNRWNETVIVGATMPLFDGNRRNNAIRQAKNEQDRAAAGLDIVRLNAAREIVSAQIALRTSVAANEAAQHLKAAAQTTYDAALDAYRQGIGTVTATIEAETLLYKARLAEEDANIATLSAAATLAFATGSLGSAPQ